MARRPAMFVLGIPEVDAALQDFDTKTRKSLARTAMRTIAKKVAEDAKRLAPYDASSNRKRTTKHVRDAIKVRAVARATGRGARQRRGLIGASARVAEGFFRGDTFYAGFLEFGTKPRFTKEGHFRGAIRQKKSNHGIFEFLRPALYGNRTYAKRHFAAAVREAIQKMRARKAKAASKVINAELA